jgi:hypothetical protein
MTARSIELDSRTGSRETYYIEEDALRRPDCRNRWAAAKAIKPSVDGFTSRGDETKRCGLGCSAETHDDWLGSPIDDGET